MADKTTENVEVVEEVKVKEVVDSPAKEDKNASEDKSEKENGASCENGNGKSEDTDDIDSKDEEVVCPVKRKSAGGDAPEGTPAEGVSPEKKAKLDEASVDAESNGEAEVAA